MQERAPRTDPPLLEALPPRARSDERVYEHTTELAATGLEVCEIRCWSGYVKSLFYAEVDPPCKQPTQSRPFRARGGDAPEQGEQAVAAYGALVEELLADGWEPDGRGTHWFSDRFRRG